MFLQSLELFRAVGVAQVIGIQIYDTDAHAVLQFAFAQLMQIRSPARILFQVFADMLGDQNVSGIATIHDSLRHVDASPGDIRLLV